MTITAKGFKEIDAKLAALGSQKGTRIFRRAMLIGVEPIIEQAKHNALKRSGSLALSIGPRFVIGAARALAGSLPALGKRMAVIIAPLKSNRVATALHNLVYGRRRKNIFHGHFIEFVHRTRGGGGSVPAHEFLGPALRARFRDAINILRAEVKDGIEREVRRR